MNHQSTTVVNSQIAQVRQVPTHVQVTSRSGMSSRERHKRTLFGLGMTEVTIGSLSVLLGVVALIIAFSSRGYYEPSYSSWYSSSYDRYYHGYTYSSQGIWCGIFLIATGFLGIRAKSNPSTCIYNANMVMSIITANISATMTILSGIAAAYTHYQFHGLIALHSILCVLGFAALIICIVHSAYCCAGVCCRRKEHQGTVSYFPQQVTIPQSQMVQLANGQYMVVQTQPNVAQYTAQTVPVVPGAVSFQSTSGSVIAPAQMPVAQHAYPAPNPQPVQSASTGQQHVMVSPPPPQPATHA